MVLDDPRASRYHAHINQSENGLFTIVDGAVINNQLRRSANKVFINGEPQFDHQLGRRSHHDRRQHLRFEQPVEESDHRRPLRRQASRSHVVDLRQRRDVDRAAFEGRSGDVAPQRDKVLEALQRKANILTALYEMSKTLGSVFDLNAIFEKRPTSFSDRHRPIAS